MAEQRNFDDMRILVSGPHLDQMQVVSSIHGTPRLYNFSGLKMQMEEEVGIFRILYSLIQLRHGSSGLLVNFLHGVALYHLCKISILEVEHHGYNTV